MLDVAHRSGQRSHTQHGSAQVSMDLTAVEVTALSAGLVTGGKAADVLGSDLTYRDLATITDTNEHESLISFGQGYHRVPLEKP